MKFYIFFFIKAVFIFFVLMQSTLATYGGNRMMDHDVVNLIHLTLCGLSLLYLGFRKKPL